MATWKQTTYVNGNRVSERERTEEEIIHLLVRAAHRGNDPGCSSKVEYLNPEETVILVTILAPGEYLVHEYAKQDSTPTGHGQTGGD